MLSWNNAKTMGTVILACAYTRGSNTYWVTSEASFDRQAHLSHQDKRMGLEGYPLGSGERLVHSSVLDSGKWPWVI